MRAIGLILAGGSSTRMKELTKNRATAALPIAGGYRSIDFVLSSMSSSRINKVVDTAFELIKMVGFWT